MTNLISGKEALIALANGEEVENWNGGVWCGVDETSQVSAFMVDRKFRLKPKTIAINGIEVPASSNVYNGGLIWILCGTDTREYTSLALDENDELPAYFWDSEDEIKQVVAALRQIFGGV